LRKQDDVADAFLAEEHQAEAINADADADAAGGRHAVSERDEEVMRITIILVALEPYWPGKPPAGYDTQ
jgi:hypothetical protein